MLTFRIRPIITGCGSGGQEKVRSCDSGGFTMVEIIMVVVILAIAAMMAIPMFSSAGSIQVGSAANMLAADLEYAKSTAITEGQDFSVIFDPSGESYRIENRYGVVIKHPVNKGFDYIVDFQDNGSLDKVDMVSADFSGSSSVTFDYLGSCDNGGTVNLQADGVSITVSVEPVTGFISISD